MRNVLPFIIVILSACSQSRNVQSPKNNTTIQQPAKSEIPPENVNPDTIRIGQMDGSVITLVGVGSPPVEYTETLDGYTIVLNNQGVYEYAKGTPSGDLVASGVKAKNPNKRDKSEIKYTEGIEKHLRYKSEKLNAILDKHKKLNRTLKKEKK
jgi:hypothetical protein